jgi:2-(1,2-epoxy-1,2-dihydrophenyl)acetyl-CoA isomerase
LESSVLTEGNDKVLAIKLNLPEKLNPLTPELRKGLKEALRSFENDPQSRVCVLTGNGRAFCAGGDIDEMKKGWETSVDFVNHMSGCNEIVSLITSIPKPIIVAVNGPAVGAGFSITMASDIAIASSKAVFSQVFAKIGLAPDMGSFYFLPRIVGIQKAKELMWTARMINAEEAMKLGIVSRLSEPENLMKDAMDLATEIASGPVVAFGLGKEILSRSLESNLQDIMKYESFVQTVCRETKDHKEGVAAFFAKRKPIYMGR